jgi:hypothetical protein
VADGRLGGRFLKLQKLCRFIKQKFCSAFLRNGLAFFKFPNCRLRASSLKNGLGLVEFLAWGRCYDLSNIFAEKFSEKVGVFYSKQSQILKKLIVTLVFKKNAEIGKNRRKL